MLALAAALAAPAAAEPVTPPLGLYAAGSATGVLGAILRRYTAETGQQVTLRTGPAGLMRERIEAGDAADLFVSANMAHPRTLGAEGKAEATRLFARNRLCVSALKDVGLTRANLLDRLLAPDVRIGTSTPGADPGGDYAQALFEKAGQVRRGATATLRAKAKQVAGGRIDEPAPAGATNARETMIARGVNASIGYCSSRATTPDTSVDKIELPTDLAIRVDYGMAVVTTSRNRTRIAAARKLAAYLSSPAAQSQLAAYGFLSAKARR